LKDKSQSSTRVVVTPKSELGITSLFKKVTVLARIPELVLALFILWPFLNLLAANMFEFDGLDYMVDGAAYLSLAATSIVLVIAIKFIPNRNYGAAAAYGFCGFFLVFLSYRQIFAQSIGVTETFNLDVSANYFFLGLGVLATMAGFYVSRSSRLISMVSTFISVACALVILQILAQALTRPSGAGQGVAPVLKAQRPHPPRPGYTDGRWKGTALTAKLGQQIAKPNVYYIIADGYLRRDQLIKHLEFDDFDLSKKLKTAGCEVFENAYANYPWTYLSLGSSLGMNYPVGDGENIDSSLFRSALTGDNAVAESFRNLSYKYLYMPTNQWSGADRCSRFVDLCLVRKAPKLDTQLDSVWTTVGLVLRLMPVSYFVKINLVSSGYSPTMPTSIIDQWERVRANAPFFLIAHSFPPHPPYVFKSDCSFQDKISFDPQRDGSLLKGLYLDNLICAGSHLKKFVKFVVSQDPTAIVIVQSDHGTKFTFELDDNWNDYMFDERYGILLAIRSPERCRKFMDSNMTPVNVLRYAFACVSNQKPEYLPNKHFVFAPGKGRGRIHSLIQYLKN
jgi:hypothetical protein